MWDDSYRRQVWSSLDQDWDVIVIGGGITGAGILREAARAGLKTLLVEAKDFASGTSSRSSKLVHGGFRYLKNAHIRLTLESVTERERLLREGKGLINRLGFLFTSLEGDPMPLWVMGAGLALYDLLARRWNHRKYSSEALRALTPALTTPDLLGGYRYFDAQTDDARLVLRLIQEAVQDGGAALNYTPAVELLRRQNGQVCGAVLEDRSGDGAGRTAEVQAAVVVNAAGAWVDQLRAQIDRPARIRPLRGSHLVISQERLPLTRAVSFFHPDDGRPVFIFPWEGVTIAGTTDVDHGPQLESDPAISPAEAEYLLGAARHVFPALELGFEDVLSTFSGIRAVINTGKADPSKESREHIVWDEDGLLTISGGKLTTFRLMARDALKAIHHRLPTARFNRRKPVLDAVEVTGSLEDCPVDPATQLRLAGRYGAKSAALLATMPCEELALIPGSPYLWAELRWAARHEMATHLDDLLLRRLRLGLMLPRGGEERLGEIRAIAQPELGWDDARWEGEVGAYLKLIRGSYSLGKGFRNPQ